MTSHASHVHFVDRKFSPPLPEHRGVKLTDYKSLGDLDDPKFSWEYFGLDKYGRYAVCRNTGIKRGLTIGEFYGTSAVD
jgi:hypothetical protein